MSTENGPGAAPGRGQPGADRTPGQATAETPAVPRPRAEENGPGAGYGGSGQTAEYQYETGRSAAATGFTYLAAALMVMGGLFGFFTGLEAIARGSFYIATSNYLYNINLTGWGWIHIIVGALVFAAGCALFARQNWARWAGIALAVISAVLNFLFIPHYPFWALTVIALDVVIIWALGAGWRAQAA